jgi:hypothetical protein
MHVMIDIIGVIVVTTAVSTSLMALWSLAPRLSRILRAAQ